MKTGKSQRERERERERQRERTEKERRERDKFQKKLLKRNKRIKTEFNKVNIFSNFFQLSLEEKLSHTFNFLRQHHEPKNVVDINKTDFSLLTNKTFKTVVVLRPKFRSKRC